MEDPLNKKYFLWVLLAWVPWVPTIIGIGYLFVGMNNSKATGLAAVAGAMAEGLVLWGVAAMFISQIAAVVCYSEVSPSITGYEEFSRQFPSA